MLHEEVNMGNIYYAAVAPNKEAAIYDGLTEAILKCMNNQIIKESFFKETFISSLRIKFKEALYKFNENDVNSICIVGTYNDTVCKAELIYINEPLFKHYYIRVEWL